MVQIADFIEAPNSGGDYRKVLLVVHVTVSAEVNGAARGVVDFWNRTQRGSTQYVVDNAEIIQSVPETAYAWAAGTTANRWGIHVEHCGLIQSVREWRDGYSTAELELSAPLFAELAAKHGIPIRRLTPEQIRHAVATGDPADGGICGHADITKAFPGETTHTDPGRYFPWRRFMSLVREAAHQEDDMPYTDWPKKDRDALVADVAAAVLGSEVTNRAADGSVQGEISVSSILTNLERSQDLRFKQLRDEIRALTITSKGDPGGPAAG